MKKGIECKYRQQDDDGDHTSNAESSDEEGYHQAKAPVPVDPGVPGQPVTVVESASQNGSALAAPEGFLDMIAVGGAGNAALLSNSPLIARVSSVAGPTASFSTSARSNGVVGLRSIQILPDNVCPPYENRTEQESMQDPHIQRYVAAYFDYFHVQWPVLHRPELKEDGHMIPMSRACVKMIGAWIVGTDESRQYAISWHNALTDQVISRLV